MIGSKISLRPSFGVVIRRDSYPKRLYRIRKRADQFVNEISEAAAEISKIRYSRVSDFSDTFELKPNVSKASEVEWISHIREYFDLGTSSYYAPFVDDYLISQIIQKDVFQYRDFPLRLLPRLVQSFRRTAKEALANSRAQLGSACFVSDVGSRKMWDDYGGSGTGIALEFDVLWPPTDASRALGEPLGINTGFLRNHLVKMNYVQDWPDVSDLDLFRELVEDPNDGAMVARKLLYGVGAIAGLSVFERIFAFKSIDYESEEEWRLMRFVGQAGSGFYPSEPLQLSRVTLGWAIGQSTQSEILEACQTLSIPARKIVPDFGRSHRFEVLIG